MSITTRTLSVTLTLVAGGALASCTIGSQIIDVGKTCVSDNDCSEDTECVAAESANADKVCMPIDEDSGQSD